MWEEVHYHQENGNDEQALRLLAELSTTDEHQVAALLQAASIYLRQGRLEQARSILGQLASRPEMANHPEFLVYFYALQQDPASILNLVTSHPHHAWDIGGAALVRDAYRQLQLEVPQLATIPPAKRSPWVPERVEFSFLAYQTSLFRDDKTGKDMEYVSQLSLAYSQPLASQWSALAGVKYGEEWSESSPEGFAPYRVQRLGLNLGGKWVSTTGRTDVSVVAGGMYSNALTYPEDDRPALGIKPELEAQVSHQAGTSRIILRHVEGSFPVPSMRRLELETYRRSTIRFQRPLATGWHAEVYGSTVDFSKMTEDYQEIGGRLRVTPRGLPRASLNLDIEREFRSQPESLLAIGADWWTSRDNGRLLILLSRFEANLDTGERQVELQAFCSSPKKSSGRWTVGIGWTGELAETHTHSAHLLLRWQP